MAVKNYRDLIAWQKAMDLAEQVYALTQSFPPDERFGMTSQLRRSSVSVPSNIAEGQGRFSDRDFHRFLSIAHGSLREAETQLELATRLRFVNAEKVAPLSDLAAEVGRLIVGLARSLKP
ncbi:MAG: four helix bundle protein [Lacipirellulaceae bacterium]